MKGFLNLPVAGTSVDGLNWTLTKALILALKDGRIVRARIGTTSDGASTPRSVWVIIPPFGNDDWPAAVAHDACYREFLDVLVSGDWTADDAVWTPLIVTEQDANQIIAEGMEDLNSNPIKIAVMYHALELFGKAAFDADRKALAQANQNAA